MMYRAIVAFVLLIAAALPAGAAGSNATPARPGDIQILGYSPGAPLYAAESYRHFAQTRTPSVPPAPQCDVSQRGAGTWKDGDIIPTGSVTGSCQQTLECVAKPEGDKRPNAACAFTVHHTADLKVRGECSDKDCKKCVHEKVTAQCEWWLTK